MKFANGMKEEGIIHSEEKLDTAREEIHNVLDKGKEGYIIYYNVEDHELSK